MQQIKSKTRQLGLPALLALASFALYSVFSFFQYRHFVTPSWDLGIFTQLAQDYARFQLPPIVEIKGAGFNLWGDHFHPILVLLGPIYWLFPSPLTLLLVQNALVAVSVFIMTAVAQRVLGRGVAALLGLAYALSFGVQNAVYVQFHEVAFALPFLAASLGHLVLARAQGQAANHLKKAVWWAMPLAFVKEDLGVTAALVGIAVILRSGWLRQAVDLLFPSASSISAEDEKFSSRLLSTARSWVRTPAVLEASFLVLWGFGWSLLAMKFILPFFNTSGVFDYADRVDLAGALGDPLQGLGQMFYPWQKAQSLGLLLLVGVAIWVFSPLALVALPTLAWRFLSTNEGYWDSTWHYSLVLMPVVFLALADSLAGFKRPAWRACAPTVFSAVALVVALVLTPGLPLARLADPAFATAAASSSDQEKQRVIDSIPAGTVVAADLSVLTYLIPDHTVYWIGHEGEPAPDYVVIDSLGTAWGGNPPADPVAYAQQRYGQVYELERQVGSISVVKKSS
ncbi:DUF2079 domain-containing protein [Rothia aerolata]|uniref:DUF2079 domain-containing protein n=1 Tax=Rothia aerolata TaxID=1812262 RepID=A0A917IPX4_9MICC|nr:DUF2079 domain-containing protein [Rothia aerolata]GGH60860.1 hypothetical protein GCM10007359_09470 [Rothia aerolata]